MKIAILNTLYHPYKIGGAEVSVQLLAESLVDGGHSVSVITLHEATESIDQLNGVTLYRLPLRNLYWPFAGNPSRPLRLLWHLLDIYNPLARADVSRLLKQIQPDVLHTNNLAGFSVAAWDAAHAQGVPVIHTSRDYYLIHPNCMLYAANQHQSPDSLSGRLFSVIKKWRSHSVGKYVAVSDHVRTLHQRQGYFRQVSAEVIYNPVTQPALAERQTSPAGTITLGYIGRLEPAKGIETALQVCRRLGPAYRLFIAGSGDSRYMTKLQLTHAGLDVAWLGHIPPEEFYPAIDILLVPSQWAEPLGRVVLEANAHGVPVVGSRSGGIPEIISQGETGYACEATDIDAFVAAVEQLVSQDQQQTRMHCQAWARQFTKENIAARYLRNYQNLSHSHTDKPAQAVGPSEVQNP
ncbi:Glycosyltransferase involved in cell wall bisynthesis [Halopseudomonas litoralis]|uniref:Glycosyltransferase involved in cell wall bisynthesis n=1 Tax=Halopseudomonas litoralis TaxID=797277 RepID=A0A1H1P5Y1_9GAMM|nr:glycosyltransferase family 4 protein [Halopseudomonas litoralis]SDS06651.1 Glycosyltransferase involved in cell wall bisynthesis [Halopseudomonas litoralis]